MSALVRDPSTNETIAEVPKASRQQLDDTLDAADRGFQLWRRVSPQERAGILGKAAQLIRERADELALVMTLEQGKPLAESRLEFMLCAEAFDWYAAEGLRANGRVMPARSPGAREMVLPQPLGPVAAFTPWNFPALLPARKIAAALAAGCSMVLKPSEETPGSSIGLVAALHDAGLPPGVLNLVLGVPAEVSEHLIRSEVIRKVTFTGSTAVGRTLALLAAQGTKPCTLELGGHAPTIVFNDADLSRTVPSILAGKVRNAGQVCTSPTRLIVQDGIYDAFVERFRTALEGVSVGPGRQADSQMGPLASQRRIDSVEELIADAADQGGQVVHGGQRLGDVGNFLSPTLITDVPLTARVMNEEPFGPVAPVIRFSDEDEAIAEANRLSYGLASYAFTQSAATAAMVSEEIEAGGVGINVLSLSLIEAPFGGVNSSGYGVEGGPEGLAAFMHPKFVHHA